MSPLRIFCNSWPKAGTHVLFEFARVVLGKGSWYQDGDIKFPDRGEDELFKEIDRRIIQHGEKFAIRGHIPWSPTIEKGLLDRGFLILFIVRDPRDVIASTFRWLRQLRKNWEVSKYLELFPDDVSLALVIRGLPLLQPFNKDLGVEWNKPLPERYQKLTPWTESQYACTVQYERVTGAKGSEIQKEEIRRIVDFLGLQNTPSVDDIVKLIYNPKSRTFHTGASGTWGNYFNSFHRKMFIDLGGEELVKRFGYQPTEIDENVEGESSSVALTSAPRKNHNKLSPIYWIKQKIAQSLKSRIIVPYFRQIILKIIKSEVIELEKKVQEMAAQIDMITSRLDLIVDSPKDQWLYKNRLKRIDATVNLFEINCRTFYSAQYDFASIFVTGKVVVDIACGTGYGTEQLIAAGRASRVIGVDIDPDAIDYAKKYHKPVNVEYICAAGDLTEIPSESVDVVVSLNTIEFVSSDIALLKEFHRLLRLGEMLICSTSNNYYSGKSSYHVRYYDLNSFEAALSPYFENIKLYSYNSGSNSRSNSSLNHGQAAGIRRITSEEKATAECYIAVCIKKTY